jgi:hypothetical protein
VASPYLTQEKALMPDLEWTRTVEAKKLFLNIANQELAVISPTIYCGRTRRVSKFNGCFLLKPLAAFMQEFEFPLNRSIPDTPIMNRQGLTRRNGDGSREFHSGLRGTNPSRFGIWTFGRLLASITSSSLMMSFRKSK